MLPTVKPTGDYDRDITGGFFPRPAERAYDPDEHLARRYNKAHDKAGKFASKAGGGAATIQLKDSSGKVLGTFAYDESKPLTPQIEAAKKSLGLGGKKHDVFDPKAAKAAPPTKPMPAGIKKGTVKGDAATLPTKEGTKDVKVVRGRSMTPAEYKHKVPQKLTRSEHASMEAWRRGDGADNRPLYSDINMHLRTGTRPRASLQKHIDNLDSAIAKHAVPEDIVVHRFVDRHALGLGPRGPGAKSVTSVAGTVLEHKGFTATTLDGELDNSAPFLRSKTIKMNITVPKGTKALYVDTDHKQNIPEKELLLGRNTRLALLSVGRGADGGWEVNAQVVH